MKINIVILFFVILEAQSARAQKITSDTIAASDFYSKGKAFYSEALFDTAQTYFQKSSDIYLKYKLWDKYLVSQNQKEQIASI